MEPTETEILVVGGGPGGYAAAFYAADLGKKVTLVDQDPRLGGVCLNRGCIPSKALLHATELMHEAKLSEVRGISFGQPQLDLTRLREWKDGVVKKLSQGIGFLAQKRGVNVIQGRGHFESSEKLRVEDSEGQSFVSFEKAIIAVGSKSSMPKAFDLGNPRIMTSREALEIEEVPGELLVIGGGYIGMELGFVYARLGSKVTVVEALDSILAGADADLARPVAQSAKKEFKEVRVKTKVLSMATAGKQIKVQTEGADGAKNTELFDRVLVAVGRKPNTQDIGLNNTKVRIGDHGFIQVDENLRTEDAKIFAIGDCVGGLMLAHKASKEARTAVETICGKTSVKSAFIPAVVFTDPEVAWCGLTEADAKKQEREIKIAKFPWAACGRALTLDRPDGLTKLIVDPETEQLLGVGIVGKGAGDLIGEAALALEMGATAFDLATAVHPHPTLSETLMEAAEVFYGHSSHALPR